ncbi:MAG TPA: hypothetical protein VK191_08135 [Symbiobacteriaceae bacterium]|nr:hypothetical protein [Symbiobacteriaceae bacterium]
MAKVNFQAGEQYKLRRDFEVRDYVTGTIKNVIRAGQTITISKVEEEVDRLFIEGQTVPLPIGALSMHVDRV